jgi:Tol biopolymer transport system component
VPGKLRNLSNGPRALSGFFQCRAEILRSLESARRIFLQTATDDGRQIRRKIGSGLFNRLRRWVVYSKWGAEKGVWKVPMERANSVRLNDAEAGYPTISPDGKTIAYSYEEPSANPPRGIAIMAFEGGPPMKRFDTPLWARFRWAANGRSLLYIKNEDGVGNIWSQPIAGGTPKQITHFNNEEIDSFDLSRDGKRLVMSRGTLKKTWC